MLRNAMMVASAAVLCWLAAPQAASAGYHYGFEYGAGWGEGVVYGPGHSFRPHYYPPPYEGYPFIGYDGPPFYTVWDDGYCYTMHRPGNRYVPARTVQSCD